MRTAMEQLVFNKAKVPSPGVAKIVAHCTCDHLNVQMEEFQYRDIINMKHVISNYHLAMKVCGLCSCLLLLLYNTANNARLSANRTFDIAQRAPHPRSSLDCGGPMRVRASCDEGMRRPHA